MPKLWNLLLTVLLLGAAYVAFILVSYDGYCYGFTDGKTPCSVSRHFENNHAWLGFLVILYFPHVLVAGGIVFLVNDAVYRAVAKVRTLRWLRGAEPGNAERTP